MNRPDYGTDAPGVVRNLIVAGSVALLLLLPAAFGSWPAQPWGTLLAGLLLFCVACFLGLGFSVLYVSRIGKLSGASVCSTSFRGAGASRFSTWDAGTA